MTMIDTAATQTARPDLQDRKHADVKRDRWLLELEHALLAMGGRRGQDAGNPEMDRAAPAQAALADVGPVARNDGLAQAHAVRVAGRGAPDAADGAAGGMGVGVGAALGAAVGTAAVDAHAAVPWTVAGMRNESAAGRAGGAAATRVPAMVAEGAPASQGNNGRMAAGLDTSGPGKAMMPEPGQAPSLSGAGMEASPKTMAPAGAATHGAPDTAPGLPAAAGPVAVAQPVAMAAAAGAGAALAMRTMAAGAVSEVGVPAAVQAARTGVAQPLTAGLPGAQAGAEQPEPAAAQEGQDTCEASSPESAPHEAEGEPFEKRLMHLFHGADGVQAWIRDAELGAAQARGLALALANELAGGGNRLAALTVNGRKVELGADSVLDPDLPADSGRQDPDAAGITREFISKGQN